MHYVFNIIAVNKHDLTPALVFYQSGSVVGKPAPSLNNDNAKVIGDWLQNIAPTCFSPDISGICKGVNEILEATTATLRRNNQHSAPPQLYLELKKTGWVLWLTLEITS